MATILRSEQTDIPNYYGGMYVTDNSTTTSIDTVSIYHPIESILGASFLSNFTFSSGTESAISSVSDAGGGEITVTTGTAHGYSAGDFITQTGTTDYNGQYEVISVGSTTEYNVTETYTSTQTGRSILGDRLICGKSGYYLNVWSMACSSISTGITFNFSPIVNDNLCLFIAERKFANNDVGSISGSAISQLTEGDIIQFGVSNITNATDIDVKHFSLQLNRI